VEYLGERSNGTWIAAWGDIPRGELQRRLGTADVYISDIDGTIGDPALAIVKDRMRRDAGNVSHLASVARLGMATAYGDYTLQTRQWALHVTHHLSTEELRSDAVDCIEQQGITESSFPGAVDFFRNIGGHVVLATRNLPGIAEVYRRQLYCGEAYSIEGNKGDWVATYITDHPQFREYVILGNSPDEEAIVQRLLEAKDQGKIDEVTSVWQSASRKALPEAPLFDVHIGKKDFRGLNEFLGI
jgi:hypothetical protein